MNGQEEHKVEAFTKVSGKQVRTFNGVNLTIWEWNELAHLVRLLQSGNARYGLLRMQKGKLKMEALGHVSAVHQLHADSIKSAGR